MASGPWRGRPTKGLSWPKVGPAQEKVVREPCTFKYEDGATCVYVGEDVKDGLCTAHRIIESRKEAHRKSEARRAKKNAARKKHKREVESEQKVQPEKIEREPVVPGPPTDPTAPYCTCKNRTADKKKCVTCGKLHFMDWVEQRRNGNR